MLIRIRLLRIASMVAFVAGAVVAMDGDSPLKVIAIGAVLLGVAGRWWASRDEPRADELLLWVGAALLLASW